MTPDLPPDPYAAYVDVLRAVGLPDEEIRSLHASDEDVDEGPLRPFVEARLGAPDATGFARRLVDVLTQSPRGMSVTGSYWNYAPEVHLNEVFEPYGCSVTFRDATHGSGQSSFEIVLEDASGTAHRTTFEYPDTPLADDNFPALLAAIERRLLSNTDLTFVLLTPIDRRWRVLMIEDGRLEQLRERYGDRIKFAGLPLLREDQPEAFERGEATAVQPRVGETAAGTGRNRSTVDRRKRPDATDELLAQLTEGVADGDASRGGVSAEPDAVFGGSPHELAARAESEQDRSAGGVEATDGELDRVFGDLSDVSLEPIPDEGGNRGPTDATIELGDADDADDDTEPEGLDDLFEQIEREALTDGDAASPSGPGDSSAAVAAAGASGSLLTVSQDRSTAGEPDDDSEPGSRVDALVEGVADGTASGESAFEWVDEDDLAAR